MNLPRLPGLYRVVMDGHRRVISLGVAAMATIVALASCGLSVSGGPVPHRIAFIAGDRDKPGDHVVVTMNEDGSGLVELGPWSYSMYTDFRQCWSSDGRRLVYVEGAKGDPARWLSVVDADGSNRRRLLDVRNLRLSSLSMSPDGRTVLLAQEERRVIEIPHDGHIDLETKYPGNIFTIDITSSRMTRLTDFIDTQAQSPVFSPDGKEIAFIGRTDDPQTHFDVYVMNADGTSIRRLTHNHSFLSFYQALQWSPDSKKILYGLETLFVTDIDHYDDIFVLDVASGKSINLTNTPEIDDAYFTWSPDGRKIAFMSSEDLRPGVMKSGVYIMDANGANVTEVPVLTGRPSWLQDSRTLIATGRAGDGTLAIISVDIQTGESKTLFSYTSIMDKYLGLSEVVWLGN